MSEHAPDPQIQQPNYYFDLSTGSLLVGETAYELHIESGANPADIKSIGEVVCDPSIELVRSQYEPLDTRGWSKEACISAGQRVLSFLPDTYEAYNPLSKSVIHRAHILGFMPGVSTITASSRFSTIPNFNRAIGLEPGLSRGIYDSWSVQQFVDYVGKMASKVPKHRNLSGQLESLSQKGEGPSPYVIRKRLGSLSRAINLAGYADPRSWEEQDYLDWGVRFMLANDGELPVAGVIEVLSPQRKAPSRKNIHDRFGTLSKFKTRLAEEYSAEVERQEGERKQKIDYIEEAIKNGLVPAELLEQTEPSSLLKIVGRYMVVSKLLAHLEESEKQDIATLRRTNSFSKAIQRENAEISLGLIETTAEEIGFFDDIWPLDNYKKVLKIPPRSERLTRAPFLDAAKFHDDVCRLLAEMGGELSTRKLFEMLFPDGTYKEGSWSSIMARVVNTPGCRLERKQSKWQLKTSQ